MPVLNIISDPPGLVTGPFYGYTGTYAEAETLFAGHGYWVKSSQSGSLIMGDDPSAAHSRARIVIERTGEGPPPPPFNSGPGEALPRSPVLLGNYPNPFNPTTNINYTLPEGADVTISIYNIFGESIGKIINEYQSAGYKSITFDARNISSGVYFYRIRVGSFSDTKKMVVIK